MGSPCRAGIAWTSEGGQAWAPPLKQGRSPRESNYLTSLAQSVRVYSGLGTTAACPRRRPRGGAEGKEEGGEGGEERRGRGFADPGDDSMMFDSDRA